MPIVSGVTYAQEDEVIEDADVASEDEALEDAATEETVGESIHDQGEGELINLYIEFISKGKFFVVG